MKESHTQLDRLDFMLVIEAILECKTITKAAQKLGVSQSALSHTLVGLRERFRDPLFVRVGAQMQPTPLVSSFADPLQRSLSIIRNEVLTTARFDPATSQRAFKVCVNEVGAFIMVPKIVRLLRKKAPYASIAPLDIPREQISGALEAGQVDLAIGYYPELKESIYQQALFSRTYVGVVRKQHPLIGESVTEKQFCDTPLIRSTSLVAINRWLERYLNRSGRTQRIALETPYVMALAAIVAETDWIAFIPDELVTPFSRLSAIRPVDLPFQLPRLQIKQHWHRRYKEDEANRFLRQVVYDALHES
jgi:DNA-binding transcriptional LysR family regulator